MIENSKLDIALNNSLWLSHKIGDTYTMIHTKGKDDKRTWKIAYYPLFGGYDNNGNWIDFVEPRALVETESMNGTYFKETPLRYLIRNTDTKTDGLYGNYPDLVKPTLKDNYHGGKVIITSTPNDENIFYEIWKNMK